MDTYKGVKLIDGRTPEMIEYVIMYSYKPATELAFELGLDSFRSIVGILRSLYSNGILIKTDVITSKKPTYKKENKNPLVIITKKENTFNNYDGTGKNDARNLISNCIAPTSTCFSNILTLPAEKWITEKSIITKKLGHKFTAVERDRDTFNNMVKHLNTNNKLLNSVIGIHKSTIGDVIENVKTDTYTHAILDYCGTIDTAYPDIDSILKRNLVRKNGFITITVTQNNRTRNREDCINNHTNKFVECCTPNLETVDITDFFIYKLIMDSNGYKLVHKLMYKDTVNGMILYIIQRIN